MAFRYKRRTLAVLLLLLEIISFVLDIFGGSNRLVRVALLLLSAIGFVTTIYTSFFSSTVSAVIRSESEWQLIAVEISFSFIQLVLTFIQLIRVFLGEKSNKNNESLLPLAFAVISVVFIFRNNEEAQVVSDSASGSHIISIETHVVESAIRRVPSTLRRRNIELKSQWEKGRLIGRGTFGSVYVGFNGETGVLCAMKEVEMFPDDPMSAKYIKQLEKEIKILSNLEHPNIVQYYGSEIVEDKFRVYLEYVSPGSINKYIREHCGAMTESIVRNFTRHILSGLAYLHRKKTIHRDIKGANLLVDASGVVKLADFGMAKHLTGQAANLSLKGSPYWIAPELMIPVMQRDNNSDLALAVDIWSLGCTIIEMYTGKPPWSEFEGVAAMFKVMKDTPSIPESLSAEGKDFLQCCFRRNPADRPLASKLLEHRFLKDSQQLPDVPSS